MRRILLFSTSTLHGQEFLEYALPSIDAWLEDVDTVLFVPWARPGGVSHADYTALFRARLAEIGRDAAGIHEARDPVAAVEAAESLFIGGGNTFVLLRQMIAAGVMDVVRRRVREGMPYVGSSAGSNVAGRTIGTTNDMPVVHPPSLDALGLVDFNINPHYLDPDPDSTHMGESRETRIREFLAFNDEAVVALREGAWLEVKGEAAEVRGERAGRLFVPDREPRELSEGDRVDRILETG